MITLANYTKRDTLIVLILLPVYTVLLNFLLFGKRYFVEGKLFLAASVITFIVMTASWQAHTWVAFTLRNRFPKDEESFTRLSIAVALFALMTGITLTILFWSYDYLDFTSYDVNENRFNWALIAGILMTVFLTVVHESVYSFQKWKETLTETEQLKKEYMQSQLIGLKNHVSPHFLFNSLNSLSSLISEDTAQAEQFLNELSKVYRYLLRNTEEQTVELETELQFVHSYYHLLKARYGSGISLSVGVGENDRRKYLPPLTLQIILDSILKTNLISKESPLTIDLYVNNTGSLEIKYNIQKKISDQILMDDSGIDHISKKFRLLSQNSIDIDHTGKYRVMKVPLLNGEPKPLA